MAPFKGVRAPFKGVRAPLKGVRAPLKGVRAPLKGVRAPVKGVEGILGLPLGPLGDSLLWPAKGFSVGPSYGLK